MNLPIEIQDKILGYLDGESLYTASKVCKLWSKLTKRRFWKLALHEISDDCLVEILGYDPRERGVDSCPWPNVYLAWRRGQICDEEPTVVAEITDSNPFTCYCATGNCLIVCNRDGLVSLYSACADAPRICTLANTGSSVWDLAVIDVAKQGRYELKLESCASTTHTEHDFVIVMGPHYVHLYQLPTDYQLCGKLMWSLDDLRAMSIAKTSIFGSTFAIAEIPTNLTLREVTLVDKSINIEELSVIVCHTWLWKWKLWKEKVICILATGEIAVWNLIASAWASVSQRYSELLYQNPCFIYRGVVFCSSRTSQSLLEYWHCFPGDSYWLVCWDGETFHKYYPKLIMGEDVTAICIKRKIVVVGTASGKLCLYEHRTSDVSIGKIWDSTPTAVVQLTDRAIRSCDLSFNGNVVTVVARTKKNLLMVAQWHPTSVSDMEKIDPS